MLNFTFGGSGAPTHHTTMHPPLSSLLLVLPLSSHILLLVAILPLPVGDVPDCTPAPCSFRQAFELHREVDDVRVT
jgi:hypothetical protein